MAAVSRDLPDTMDILNRCLRSVGYSSVNDLRLLFCRTDKAVVAMGFSLEDGPEPLMRELLNEVRSNQEKMPPPPSIFEDPHQLHLTALQEYEYGSELLEYTTCLRVRFRFPVREFKRAFLEAARWSGEDALALEREEYRRALFRSIPVLRGEKGLDVVKKFGHVTRVTVGCSSVRTPEDEDEAFTIETYEDEPFNERTDYRYVIWYSLAHAMLASEKGCDDVIELDVFVCDDEELATIAGLPSI
jgi:hypothetical protein